MAIVLSGAAAAAILGATEGWVWRDANGAPLPFQTDAEILDFLRDAEVVSTREIGHGVTRPLQALLRRQGVEARATFRYHHEARRDVRLEGGRRERFFFDSYRGEAAAYRLAARLGLDHVPPTLLRRLEDRDGSLQIWVEGATLQTTHLEQGVRPPAEAVPWVRLQAWDLWIFDNLVRNIDRNSGNLLWDDRWHMWWIDCTRCFSRSRDLPEAERVARVSTDLWSALGELDGDVLDELLRDVLSRQQIRSLAHRRNRIVSLLEARMRDAGEEAVLVSPADGE